MNASVANPAPHAFIGGAAVPAETGDTFSTYMPSSGEVLAEVAACGRADVDRAVEVARQAFDAGTWSRIAPVERKLTLLRFADAIEANRAEIARLDAVDAGKPITDCEELDLPDAINTIRWFAEAIDKVFGKISPTGDDVLGLITHEPRGVVAAVLPWNFPTPILAWKLGPALAAGNSIVVKPAEQAPLSTLRIAEIAVEAGIPEGVFNVVPGLGEVAGRALGLHPDVDMVAFTGSTSVGREFLRYSADSNMKEVVLECGGKSPQIVMADANRDLSYVADQLATAAFWNGGQNCTCGSRILVDRRIQDDLLEALSEAATRWRVGDPLDPETKVGPMIEASAVDRITGYIGGANAAGARLVHGGKRILEDTGGWYVEPTVFSEVTPDMAIAREEVFGPVVSVLGFGSEAEAVAMANDTPYGLAASIYTHDLDTAHRLARDVRAGTVAVNCYGEGDITTPFGGYKQSGFGGRDKGLEALAGYCEVKTTWMALRDAR